MRSELSAAVNLQASLHWVAKLPSSRPAINNELQEWQYWYCTNSLDQVVLGMSYRSYRGNIKECQSESLCLYMEQGDCLQNHLVNGLRYCCNILGPTPVHRIRVTVAHGKLSLDVHISIG